MPSRTADHESKSFKLLGVRVDCVQIPAVVERIQTWIALRDACKYVAVTGMHGVVEARHNREFCQILNAADLIVPDGMPLIWIGRKKGHELNRRVYGPELMLSFLTETAGLYKHFFYGGAPGIPEKLAETLKNRIHGLKIAGTYSPPFRPLTSSEDHEIVSAINGAAPDVLWVGLSTPKQEQWMYQHRDKLTVPVMVGVGAAFDFHSGTKKQAPVWMREHGLEWLFRLLQEPRRLWRRYVLYGLEFVFLVAAEEFGLYKPS